MAGKILNRRIGNAARKVGGNDETGAIGYNGPQPPTPKEARYARNGEPQRSL